MNYENHYKNRFEFFGESNYYHCTSTLCTLIVVELGTSFISQHGKNACLNSYYSHDVMHREFVVPLYCRYLTFFFLLLCDVRYKDRYFATKSHDNFTRIMRTEVKIRFRNNARKKINYVGHR